MNRANTQNESNNNREPKGSTELIQALTNRGYQWVNGQWVEGPKMKQQAIQQAQSRAALREALQRI